MIWGNPVTGIMGFAKLAKAEPNETVREDYCDRIVSSALAISRMMIDIKTVAQGVSRLGSFAGPAGS
jgi:hypothetical protein